MDGITVIHEIGFLVIPMARMGWIYCRFDLCQKRWPSILPNEMKDHFITDWSDHVNADDVWSLDVLNTAILGATICITWNALGLEPSNSHVLLRVSVDWHYVRITTNLNSNQVWFRFALETVCSNATAHRPSHHNLDESIHIFSCRREGP